MASTTLNRVKTNQDAADISAATLARLVGVAPSTLTAAYRDQVYLGSEVEARLVDISCQVVELKNALSPLREPTNADDLRDLLRYMKDNDISTDRVREAVSSLFGFEGTK
jgi:hypothetical protein